MLHLLNTYLLFLNLRTLSPMLWISLKDQLTYPEIELAIPIWQWLQENTTASKKAIYHHNAFNSFSTWIQNNYSSVQMTTYRLTDDQAKDILTFLRANKEYL